MSEVLLVGADHEVGSRLTVVGADDLFGAICVGDERAPTWRSKGALANEDALSGRDDGRFARLVVADSHWGGEASCHLVEALHDAPLHDALPTVAAEPATDGSETTLTVVWLDRQAGAARVQSCGDSLALRLRGDQAMTLHELDTFYTSPQEFSWDLTSAAQVAVEPGDVLVAYTDGVHECNRGRPGRSVAPHHVAEIYRRAQTLEEFVLELATTALVGVDGNPGGEDNIAIVAIRV